MQLNQSQYNPKNPLFQLGSQWHVAEGNLPEMVILGFLKKIRRCHHLKYGCLENPVLMEGEHSLEIYRRELHFAMTDCFSLDVGRAGAENGLRSTVS